MKIFFSFLCVLFLFVKTMAQLIAEDFTLTDVNGIERNLYQELDQQKTVVLNFFITNCGTCQINTSKLDSIWQKYGYNGDSVWVWGIESSGLHDSLILEFVSQYQVSFPCYSTLFDDVVLYVYNITYTPQYFVICPNRSKKQVTVNQIESAIIACKQTAIQPNLNYETIHWDNEKITVSTTEPFDVFVFDMFGRIIFAEKNISSSISLSLNKGTYLILIKINEKSYRKLIVNY